MNVSALRTELKARNINSKGLKSQLVARLTKALKMEAEKTEDSSKDGQPEPEPEVIEEKKAEAEERKLDEKEKAQLEKRYALPDQQHIIVHPSRTAKSGKFDCTTMSLSLLLDYRPEDTKEHSFEVSLFAELFNEMLMRDFGFNIYRALYELPEKVKEKEERKRKDEDRKADDDKKKDDDRRKDDEKKREEKDKKDEKEKKEDREKRSEDRKDDRKKDEDRRKDSKKEDKKSDNIDDTEDDDEYDDEDSKDKKKSDKDRKKKERPKMFTKDRHLLLSFVYFDQTHCGYIFEKDMEDLLFTLGLNLSRAQVRKLVGKVISRDSLHYRKLTDKPKDEDFIVIDDSEKDVNLMELATGNKRLLPIFHSDCPPAKKMESNSGDAATASTEDGLVMFRGAVVDVTKLMAQLERSDKARIETETRMIDLKTENTKITEKYNKSSSSIRSLNSELKEYKEKLKTSDESLIRMSACYKLFQTTLTEIRDKIDPVLKSTMYKEEVTNSRKDKDANEKERKHDESKTRWEKNNKDTAVKDEPMELDTVDLSDDIKHEIKMEQ
ncbi:hypothetical protein ILUMI_05521 [Ignelater luminosus]|uniref:SAP domain-containing protein n=1 Tax=Ignelater luminosus TaxID=2038154 RepID=A0A8K0DAC5_IGNLU|nr:hypothetical protein ILUMI_05521 [Ignelater luminosus]